MRLFPILLITLDFVIVSYIIGWLRIVQCKALFCHIGRLIRVVHRFGVDETRKSRGMDVFQESRPYEAGPAWEFIPCYKARSLLSAADLAT